MSDLPWNPTASAPTEYIHEKMHRLGATQLEGRMAMRCLSCDSPLRNAVNASPTFSLLTSHATNEGATRPTAVRPQTYLLGPTLPLSKVLAHPVVPRKSQGQVSEGHLPLLLRPFLDCSFPPDPEEGGLGAEAMAMLICPSWISCLVSAGRWLICCCVSR